MCSWFEARYVVRKVKEEMAGEETGSLLFEVGVEPGFLDLLGVILMIPFQHLTSNNSYPT
jgi:hypothetical protein